MRALAILMMGLATAACSMSDIGGLDAPEAEPPYRKLIAENMYKILPRFPKPATATQGGSGVVENKSPDEKNMTPLVTVDVPTSLTSYQISHLRRVHHLIGWAWVTCLKIADQPGPIAIFIRDNQIADWRRSVILDDCESQTYEVLELPEPPPPPPPPPKRPAKRK